MFFSELVIWETFTSGFSKKKKTKEKSAWPFFFANKI